MEGEAPASLLRADEPQTFDEWWLSMMWRVCWEREYEFLWIALVNIAEAHGPC